jgi:hypothetical protein
LPPRAVAYPRSASSRAAAAADRLASSLKTGRMRSAKILAFAAVAAAPRTQPTSAEEERRAISQRTKAALAAAKARGVKLGAAKGRRVTEGATQASTDTRLPYPRPAACCLGYGAAHGGWRSSLRRPFPLSTGARRLDRGRARQP